MLHIFVAIYKLLTLYLPQFSEPLEWIMVISKYCRKVFLSITGK